MVAAVRAYQQEVLAAENERADPGSRGDVGRDLLHMVFGTQDRGQEFPSVLAAILADPDSELAQADLMQQADEAFESDPAMTAAAAARISEFYRRQADAGNLHALVDLGDFQYWDEPRAARAAYQEAIDAGHLHAMIDLAKVLCNVINEEDAALAVYQQAINSGDADIAAEAMIELAHVHAAHGDAAAARAMYQQVIDTRHPRWAAAAMLGLAHMLERLDEPAAADALYRQVVEAGNPEWSARALVSLGDSAKSDGDVAGAMAAWQRVIESGNATWAGPAFIELTNLLREHDDIDGLRAVYQRAAELGNPEALYALDVLGQELERQGDTAGAHAAWQQAIDAGYEDADELRDRISPPTEPPDEADDDAELADLPPQFDPRNMRRTGLDVLEHGLPALPENLTYRMAIPVAY